MLHIRNTLRKRYTFKTSNLHHHVLRVILHLAYLLLHQQIIVYIWNRQVPKSAFSPSSSSFAFRRSNSRTHEPLAPFFISIRSVYYNAGL